MDPTENVPLYNQTDMSPYSQTDIHGTDWSKHKQVLSLGMPPGLQHLVVNLTFVPSEAQARSFYDHILSWTPPDA